jgi:hypothetical protein
MRIPQYSTAAPDRRVAAIIIAECADGQQFAGVAWSWRAGIDPGAAMDAHGWHATGCAMRDAVRDARCAMRDARCGPQARAVRAGGPRSQEGDPCGRRARQISTGDRKGRPCVPAIPWGHPCVPAIP